MRKRLIPILILIAYSALLVNIMVFKRVPVIRVGHLMLNFGGTHGGAANLVPFKTIVRCLLGEKGFMIAFVNIAGNIALLVPVGFILPLVYPAITWKKCLAPAIASGLTIECMQALLRVGMFDVDDILLNGLGVMLGFWVFVKGAKMGRATRVKYIIAAAVLVVGAGVFCLVALTHDGRRPVRLPQATNGFDSTGTKRDSLPPAGLLSTAVVKGEAAQLPDPCGGTGGTGQVVSVGNHTITIKRNDGVEELIKLGEQTKIKNAAGALAETDLKVGYRVTIVVGLVPGDERMASTVLVCKGK